MSPKGKKITPQEFCRSNSLPPPISISVKHNTLNNLFDEAVEAVRNNIAQRRIARKQKQQRWYTSFRIGGTAALLAAICFGAVLLWKSYRPAKPIQWYKLT